MGPVGSGKGIASKYVAKKYNYNIINLGNIVRILARKHHITPTRKNLEKLQAKYSHIYHHDFVIEHALEKAHKSNKQVILDGIRKPVQAKLAKQKLRARLILVDSKPEIRFERMKKRRRHNFPKTIAEFKKEEANENRVFNLKKTFSMADYRIDNSDGEKKFLSQVDKIMKKING